MNAPHVVFVLGGPGSGKGTQCRRLEEKLGYKHISAGDCLREEQQNPTSKNAAMIQHYIKEGLIVPVELTCSLLRKKMNNIGWNNGKFCIDGFPRNQNNYDGWEANMTDVVVDFCLFIDCPEEVMEKRLLSRGSHSGRVDDNVESIRKRFNTYKQETTPIIQKFELLGKCYCINGCLSIEKVWEQILNVFKTNLL